MKPPRWCRHQWITTVQLRNRQVKEVTTATCAKCGEVRRWTWPTTPSEQRRPVTAKHKQPDLTEE
jgi:predicted nucleic acid-binding Zn ribbon protein